MTKNTRRKFIKQSATLITGLTLSGCDSLKTSPSQVTLDPEILGALGEAVLPKSALGPAGVFRVVSDFQKWLRGFKPAAELDHPYLKSHEIPYGPPDPRLRWASQLEALEIKAHKQHGASFWKLVQEEKLNLVRREIQENPLDSLISTPVGTPTSGRRNSFPTASRAGYVAVGLLAYFYSTSEANDLCYLAGIGEHTCRGFGTATVKPVSLKKGV